MVVINIHHSIAVSKVLATTLVVKGIIILIIIIIQEPWYR